MSITHASSSVTLPVPPPVESRTSLERNAPDEGDSDGVSRRTGMPLGGAMEDPRVKMYTQMEGGMSTSEGSGYDSDEMSLDNEDTFGTFAR